MKTTLKMVALVWKCMEKNWRLYIGAIGAIAFSTFFAFLGPVIIRITVDSIISDKPVMQFSRIVDFFGRNTLAYNIWICSLFLIVSTIFRGFFSFLSGRCCAVASEKTIENLRNRLYDHMQRLPYEEYVRIETGDVMQRCTSDVETVRKFIAIQLLEIGRTLCMIGIAVPMMLSIHKVLSIAAVLVIPLLIGFSYFFFRNIQGVFQEADEAEGRLSNVLQENVTGVRVVKAFGNELHEIEKFDEKNREFSALIYKFIRLIAFYWSCTDFLSMAQIGIVLVVSVILAHNGSLSVGTLLAFLMYEGMLLWPIRHMGRVLADMGKALVSIRRIQEILDKPVEQDEKEGICPVIKGTIEFRKVGFRYNNGPWILKDVSFRIEQGMTVAILGPTGSGKSTLAHLLQRLYEYTSGSITIDGTELSSIHKTWIRNHVGIVLQEPFLYAKSIRENIGMAKEIYTHEEVEAAAGLANIHQDIMGFDKNYDTLIGEKGVTVSGGQKQRIAIARAVIKQCPILIFDDSLSAVDPQTDAVIRKTLKEKMNDTTKIIIAHRLVTLMDADLILVFQQGRLTQCGTHETLVRQEGLYQRIWRIQNSSDDLSFEKEELITC